MWLRPTAASATRCVFLLANTADFDIARDAVPLGRVARHRPLRAGLHPRDGAAGRGRLREVRVPPRGAGAADLLLRRISAHFTSTSQGSALHEQSRQPCRRSAQTALWHITQTLGAPDGTGAVVHRRRSVELAERTGRRRKRDAHLPRAARAARREGLIARWEIIRGARADALKVIEGLRTAGKVGSSLQATLTLAMTGKSTPRSLRSAATSNSCS